MKKLFTLFTLVCLSTAAFAAWPAQKDIEKAVDQQVKSGWAEVVLRQNAKIFVTIGYYTEAWPEGSQHRKPPKKAMCEGLIITEGGLVILGKECAQAVSTAYELSDIQFILKGSKRVIRNDYMYREGNLRKDLFRVNGPFALYRMTTHLPATVSYNANRVSYDGYYETAELLRATIVYFQPILSDDEIVLDNFENYFGVRPTDGLKKLIELYAQPYELKVLKGSPAKN